MELNPDCVRAVLKFLEQATCLHKDETGKMVYVEIKGKKLAEEPSLLAQGFQPDQIFYTAVQLIQGRMVKGNIEYAGQNEILFLAIIDLTWEGHEFLKSTESDGVWNRTKEVAQKIGVYSLKGITQIAGRVLSGYITAALTGQLPS